MLPATNALDKLQAHPVLRHLTLDGVVTFTRLTSHLKRDSLQPQPIPQSNPSIPRPARRHAPAYYEFSWSFVRNVYRCY
ncbi:hypothetical protein K443DRAFT_597631 [Laccaria amethystina LaAM-08-1]|uniref:Uncharacterized protein n=1 Tax=Laccaria amethystina LaAM-08-1 TaxID=1095629 RepID=A0A0C9WQQ7_9AGAR|nr:hypothetical protein K443DRAFT_597631 [Laccaria amethystina LaAM-08-1]